MLSFFLLLTFVMLKHTLLQLFSFKISFFKGNNTAKKAGVATNV